MMMMSGLRVLEPSLHTSFDQTGPQPVSSNLVILLPQGFIVFFTYSLFRWVSRLALVPGVVVPEVEQRCAWSRNLDPNFCPDRGRTSDLGI